jgi:hypothetical protein
MLVVVAFPIAIFIKPNKKKVEAGVASGLVEKLSELWKLHSEGLLTDGEFSETRLINGSVDPSQRLEVDIANNDDADRQKARAKRVDKGANYTRLAATIAIGCVGALGIAIPALLLLWPVIFESASKSTPSLQVSQGPLCTDVSNPNCAVTVVRILNRGHDVIRIKRVTVNDKPQCFYDVNETLSVGYMTTISAFGLAELQDAANDTLRNMSRLVGKDTSNFPSKTACAGSLG